MAGEAVLRVVVEDGGEVTAPIPVPQGQPGIGGGGRGGVEVIQPGWDTLTPGHPGGKRPPAVGSNVWEPLNNLVPGSGGKGRPRRGQSKTRRPRAPRSPGVLSTIAGPLNKGANVASALLGGGGVAATVAGTATALGGVGVAAGVLISTFGGLADKAGELTDRVGKYSGIITAEQARQQVLGIQNQIRLANQFGGPLADFAEARGNMDRQLDNISAHFLTMLVNTRVFHIIERVLEKIEKFLEQAKNADDFGGAVGKGAIHGFLAAIPLGNLVIRAGDLFGLWEEELQKAKAAKVVDKTMDRLLAQINMPQFQPGPHLPIPPVNPLGAGG